MPSSTSKPHSTLSSTLCPYTTLFRSERLPELGLRILRMRKPLRQGGIGPRPACRVGVNEQRQDRMEEGRRRELDLAPFLQPSVQRNEDRKSTRLNSSHRTISYAVFYFKAALNSELYPLSLHDALPI